ncbi:MAG: hypothetical protein IKO55_12355 [Kiritimatiellae bacterium]|nr:hypothetical protein [Kiritimatiellia bacterium]
MKKFVVSTLVLVAIIAVAALAIKYKCPDSDAAAFVDKCWGKARGEFSDAWARVNAQDVYSASLEKSIVEAEETPDEADAQNCQTGPGAFTEANRYVGTPIESEDSLRGKVVLVYVWSIENKQSAILLPRVERIWEALGHKPLVVITSHRGGRRQKVERVIRAAKLTVPTYEGAGLSVEPRNTGKGPCFYVVNPDGKLVHVGRGEREATAAVINAFQ